MVEDIPAAKKRVTAGTTSQPRTRRVKKEVVGAPSTDREASGPSQARSARPVPAGPSTSAPAASRGAHPGTTSATQPADTSGPPAAPPAGGSGPPPTPPPDAGAPPSGPKVKPADPGPPQSTALADAPAWIRLLSWLIVLAFLGIGLLFLARGFSVRNRQSDYNREQRKVAVEQGVIAASEATLPSIKIDERLVAKRRELATLPAPNQADQTKLEALQDLRGMRPPIAPGRAWSIAFGFLTVGAMLLLVQGIRSTDTDGHYGIFRPLIGGDQRFSTSLTQVWLWTLAATTAFGFLLARVIFEGQDLARVLPDARWDDYLILLGGPFAASVIAKGTVQWKIDKGQVQKTEGTPAPTQVFRGDDGAADLVDTQYLLFNGIALGYFVTQILATPVLPQIPGPLLAMTSGTAALYVGNKAAQRNAPMITGIDPKTVTPGAPVKVTGANFAPGEASDLSRRASVVVEGVVGDVPVLPGWSNTCIEFVLPLSAAPGPKNVTVISSAGIQTAPVQLDITTRKPIVAGVVGPLRPGSDVTVVGLHLTPAQGELAWVSFGEETAVAIVGDGTSLTVKVPPGLEGDATGKVEVRVRVGSGADAVSDPIKVAVQGPKIWGVDVNGTSIRVRGSGFTESGEGDVQLLVDGVTVPGATYAKAGPAEVVSGSLGAPPAAGSVLHVRVIDDLGRHGDYTLTL
jgi:hypothetical protein